MHKENTVLTDKEVKITKSKVITSVIKLFYGITWKLRKRIFFLSLIDILTSSIRPFANILLSRQLINELTGSRDIDKIVLYTGLIVGFNLIFSLISTVLYHSYSRSRTYLDKKFDEILIKKIMEIDFEHTEDPEVLNQIEKAKNGLSWYSGGPVEFIRIVRDIITGILQFAGSVVIFILGYPVLLIVIIIALFFISILNKKMNDCYVRSFIKLSGLNRAYGYYLYGIMDIIYGKEIRLYHAEDMMKDKSLHYTELQCNEWKAQSDEVLKYDRISTIVHTINDFFTYLILGYGMIKKLITVGDFTMYVGMVETFKGSIWSIIYNVQELHKRGTYAYEFIKFMEYPDAKSKGTRKLELKQRHTIEFKNVSFRYPRSEQYTLSNVSITIHEGEHLSIVGLNGAGKTTFIKLLCRLYDVTEGEILLDGINIKEYDYDEYIKAISVVFQDFRLFAFTAAENILLGDDTDRNKDELDEIVKLSGLNDTVSKLKHGLDTHLYKSFEEEGIELSGGQQQKLAIARALYKNAPIIILDEPTAALDPVAEYEIYRQFDTLVGGKTAVYISHRLSSCKFCDRIAVFSENTIKEYGTHEELIKHKDGIYSKMFMAQAQYYY